LKPVKNMTVGELAAFVATHLRGKGIDVVLSGGSCVTIYSEGKYVSGDLDMIEIRFATRREIQDAMTEIDFHERDRFFQHADTELLVEFPPGPLAVGKEPVRQVDELRFSTGTLRIISPTDCVKDRLAAYYHWKDRQSLEQAVLVAHSQNVDLKEIRRWSKREGMLEIYQSIAERLTRR
jgi:hypothetical protein